jgi:4-amino-4-deoxy-L-arabinose transferase-like glycosyltransferase
VQESRNEWAVPTFLSMFVFAFVLSANPTLDSHEVLVAQTAREMIASGDYIHPTFAGEPRLQKPPLAYWLCAASYWWCGEESERAARLPSGLSAMFGVMITSIFARRTFGRGMGFLAGSVQATSIWTISYGRLAIVDSVLTTLVAAAMLVACWDRLGKPADGRSWVWVLTPLFWTLCGLIVLAKGPVGLAMLLPPVIVYRWMRGRSESDSPLLSHPAAIFGIVLFLILSLTWPVAVLQRYPEAWALWTGQSLGRFQEHWGPQTRPWWYFFVQTPWLMFPWSLAVFAVAIRRPRIDWREPNRLLVLLWFGTAFSLCTLSAGKRAHYILPALPAACVITALAVRRLLAAKLVGWDDTASPTSSNNGHPMVGLAAASHPTLFRFIQRLPFLILLLALVETIVFAGVVELGRDLTGFRQMVERNEELLQRSTVVQVGSRERATVFSINKPLRWLPTPPESVEETMLILVPEKHLPELMATGHAKIIDKAGPDRSRVERSPSQAFALVELEPLRR